MSLAVNVLTPTGRRQIVKVNHNTSILQILEDVCKKQELLPAEYDLKHYNTRLDLSSTVRFSNLPNNAQLELVKAIATKIEANVTIVLQLPSGERLMAEFSATQSLYEIIVHWQNKKGETLLQVEDECGNTMAPVCIYIRREVVGEESLKATTLRSLGLTNGKAIVRLNYRSSDKPQEQAYVESLVLPQSKRESFSKYEQNQIEEVHCEENWDTELQNQNASQIPSSSRSDHEMQPSTSNAASNAWVEQQNHEWGPGQSSRDTSSNYNEKSKSRASDKQAIVIDKEDRKRPAEKENDPEEQLVYLDDKGSLLYRLDDTSKQPVNDYLPDEFFIVTLDDVRLLLSDLTRQRKEMENIPLQTQALREAAYLSRLNKYPKSVLRINFPDRCVLQGSFRSIDTVEKVTGFVKSFLEDENLDFHLYTTPPKNVLKPEDRLFELALVPAAVIHFSSDMVKEHYLRPDVMEKISSLSAANYTSRLARSSNNSEPVKHDTEYDEKFCTTSVNLSKSENLPEEPSTSRLSQQHTIQSTGAIPKWFKTGKN